MPIMDWQQPSNFQWSSANQVVHTPTDDFQFDFNPNDPSLLALGEQQDPRWNNFQWQPQTSQDGTNPLFYHHNGIADSPASTRLTPPSNIQLHENDFYDQESDDDQDGSEDDNQLHQTSAPKRKLTRSSRACTVCRRLKLRCVGAENGGKCRKCTVSNQECIFPESKRGKSTKKTQEELTTTVKKMEQTLATVIRSINDPALSSFVSGMTSCPPSPREKSNSVKSFRASDSESSSSRDSRAREIATPSMSYLPVDSLNPLGLLAETSLANDKSADLPARPPHEVVAQASLPKADDAVANVGIANERYFRPGNMNILPIRRMWIEHAVQPEMLSFVSTDEVLELFQIYFKHLNSHCALLVPDYHTPSYVCSRSPFLLTTICAIASRFSDKLIKHHKRLSKLSRRLAFDVPSKGYKSLEIVQAYLLLTLWGYGHSCKYEHDTTWLVLGLAIRTATDLNLHRQTPSNSSPTPEGVQAVMEARNRERTWILCFVLDRSLSTQLGKPHTIQEDHIIRNVSNWWHHPFGAALDAGLAAYAELQRILTRSLELMSSDSGSPSGLQAEVNYLVTVKSVENQINSLRDEWAVYLDKYNNINREYWKTSGRFYFHYAILLLNSFGLQDALYHNPINLPHFFSRCHQAAVECVTVVRDYMVPLGFLRYSPTSHFVQFSYAVLTLLKLSRPEFHPILDCREEALKLATEVSEMLSEMAIDPQHAPGLYGEFLKEAIASRQEELEGLSLSSPEGDPQLVSPAVTGGQEEEKENGYRGELDGTDSSYSHSPPVGHPS